MKAIDDILPWWEVAWQSLSDRRDQGRFPHAILLTGAGGLGKRHFARSLAQSLLCERPGAAGTPCGACTGCALFAAGSHPDFLQVEPAEEGKAIVVDQIRALSAGLSLSSHAGGFKVATLTPADRMNAAAANSLLKTLEEPSDNTVLMLVSERPAALPATVRSRCQQIRFAVPAVDLALQWLTPRLEAPEQAGLLLDLAAGAPLLALELGRSDTIARRHERFAELSALFGGKVDVLEAAARWAQEKDLESLQWLTGWIMDMIRLKTGGQPSGLRSSDLRDGLMALAKALDSKQLYGLLDRLWDARRLAQTSVNRQLLMEDVLIGWAQMGMAGHGRRRQVQS
ncbi:MAG: DNA polymerase III subunit delta' [Gammaproteobacteria bacterium]